jgi:hypothetical protein
MWFMHLLLVIWVIFEADITYHISSIKSNTPNTTFCKILIKSCIWSVAVYGSETWTLGKNGEGRKCT